MRATPHSIAWCWKDYHQQYMSKNPNGYCPNHSTGVRFTDDQLAALSAVGSLQYVDR
jgi:hypothetical protein